MFSGQPTIIVIQSWPSIMDSETAAAYLGESKSQFIKICRLYPDRLRSFNLLANGETRWDRDDIEMFKQWRKVIGVERRTT